MQKGEQNLTDRQFMMNSTIALCWHTNNGKGGGAPHSGMPEVRVHRWGVVAPDDDLKGRERNRFLFMCFMHYLLCVCVNICVYACVYVCMYHRYECCRVCAQLCVVGGWVGVLCVCARACACAHVLCGQGDGQSALGMDNVVQLTQFYLTHSMKLHEKLPEGGEPAGQGR